MTLALTALAGGLGALARLLVDSAVTRRWPTSVPLGTVVVNVTACLLLGAVTGWAGEDVSAIVGTGLLGGYSTFSTASVEAWRLVEEGRPLAAFGHGGGMLAACLAAAALGLWLAG